MTTLTSGGPSLPRVIGDYEAGNPGPLMIVLAGIHGNEPSGVVASRRILGLLREREIRLRGRLVALAGNRKALEAGIRFVRSDLNRIWTEERTAALRSVSDPLSLNDEDRELFELHQIIERLLEQPQEQTLVIDLHSTSGAAPPFTIISDTLRNRRIAFAVPVPVVLGLEETIDGTTLSYFGDRGLTAVGIEGGQHHDPATADNHEACLWMMLAAAGMVQPSEIPDDAKHRLVLKNATGVLPRVVEIIHRHGVPPEDGMVMKEGYRNFDEVRKGEMLATEQGKQVDAPVDGILLLPRYQPLGDDGFFLARPVNPFWLQLSAVLRILKLDRLLQFFPGIRHEDGDPHILLANPRVARWFTIQVFHLFGYRRRGTTDGMLRFSRRPEKPEA